ncbi:hypothetical protein ACHAXT_011610 [Thalassiosira profunda]
MLRFTLCAAAVRSAAPAASFRSPLAFVARTASSRPAKYTAIYSSQRILPLERPNDPSSLGKDDVKKQAKILRQWFDGKRSVVCLTGAGMSTESGIPDYRGNNGSYHRGHKPIIHHEYMQSEQQRKRYWARSLVGFSAFADAQPNLGHKALATLESKGLIGVELDAECTDFNRLGDSCVGSLGGVYGSEAEKQRVSVITQNVDSLHARGGLQHCLHLHGRGDLVKCMSCGTTRDRKEYHEQLMQSNKDWLEQATARRGEAELRPDGDAELGEVTYDAFTLPGCEDCGSKPSEDDSDTSFFKTDVVFFGDSVPKHRFDISYSAIDAADGVLCIGTSLAVHSAFRLVKRAIENSCPVAILNVGETRVEREGLGDGLVTKLESPIGETLAELVSMLDEEE